jgi:propionyl-CoA carboxylase alpha chain
MFPHGFAPPTETVAADRIILIAAALADARLHQIERPDGNVDRGEQVVLLDGRPHRVAIRPEHSGDAITVNGDSFEVATDWRPGQPLLHLRIEDQTATVQIERRPGRVFALTHGGVIRRAQVLSPQAAELLEKMPEKQVADTSRLVLSPMPGLLTSVAVEEGQEVKAGEPLVVVEAMKMENVLRAERDGRIAKLRAKPGDSLAVDQVILELE